MQARLDGREICSTGFGFVLGKDCFLWHRMRWRVVLVARTHQFTRGGVFLRRRKKEK